MKELALKDFPDDEGSEDGAQATEESDEDENDGTGVQTSQLRHFVIQVRKLFLAEEREPFTNSLFVLPSGVCTATIAH